MIKSLELAAVRTAVTLYEQHEAGLKVHVTRQILTRDARSIFGAFIPAGTEHLKVVLHHAPSTVGKLHRVLFGEFARINALDRSCQVESDDEDLAERGLRAAARLSHKTATDAGWYRNLENGEPVARNFGEVVALMHSELSEALEADRKGLRDDKLPHLDGRAVEFADCILRILDTCEALGLDVAGALIEKNRLNRTRADHRPENRRQGGKRY